MVVPFRRLASRALNKKFWLTFLQRAVPGCTYQKNYEFDFDFGGLWGRCQVTMTSVSGHMMEARFGPEITKDWCACNPIILFDAPVHIVVDDKVCKIFASESFTC